MSLYFADYSELVEKIRSKEYKWKDLQIAVQQVGRKEVNI